MDRPRELTVIRGGVTLIRNVLGNLSIQCRGDGAADCQNADIPDLLAAIAEVLRTANDGESSPGSESVLALEASE